MLVGVNPTKKGLIVSRYIVHTLFNSVDDMQTNSQILHNVTSIISSFEMLCLVVRSSLNSSPKFLLIFMQQKKQGVLSSKN